MADLIAQSVDSQHQWRRPIPPGETHVLGRGEGTFAVPWDRRISRQHAEIRWLGGSLEVRRIPSSRNVISYRGQEPMQFTLRPGESFVIGGTTFTLIDDRPEATRPVPPPAQQWTYAFNEIQAARYRDADLRIDVLGRLPDVIKEAPFDRNRLFEKLIHMLLLGLPRADGVALLAVGPDSTPEKPNIRTLRWEPRWPNQVPPGGFHPSEQLVLKASREGQSSSYVWSPANAPTGQHDYTMTGGVDWAYCTPVSGSEAESWAIYVFGRFGPDALGGPPTVHSPDLIANLKFTELVASFLGALGQVRRLQREQAVLAQFFPPVVIKALAGADPEKILAARETEGSFLFCDLQGFSREAERNAGDLLGLHERVSQALQVMTHAIKDQGGVIGDFQGDSAMGFWGWPVNLGDSARRACLAALDIRAQFEADSFGQGRSLANFQIKIGIASGIAVAGKIGSVDQAKVSAFGPVVNLASRLEGMSKMFHAPILLDEPTATQARALLTPDRARFRKLATVLPYGMKTPCMVTELLPPAADWPILSDDQIRDYEAGVEAFERGHWPEALAHLGKVPHEDRVKDYLTGLIVQRDRTPPEDWDGVIVIPRKN